MIKFQCAAEISFIMLKYIIIIVNFIALNANSGEKAFISFDKKSKINLMKSLKHKMDYTLQRQAVIAENIASQDVPNYRAKDLKKIDINKLKENVYKVNVNLSGTNPLHIKRNASLRKRFKTIKEKLDYDTTIMGNNVDLSEQMIKANENIADYNTTTTIYKKMSNLMKMVAGK